MLTDEEIDLLYEAIQDRIDKVNSDYLRKVAEQIVEIGELNPSSARRLAQMRIYGANVRKLKQKLKRVLNASVDNINTIFEKAVEAEYTSADFLGLDLIPFQENARLQKYVRSLAEQTAETMENYSNTTNIDSRYKEVVTEAIDAVSRGVTDYNSAIRDSMRKLGGDGLRVTYESGVTRRLDTAIRQNILDGTRQIAQQAQKLIGEEIGADGVELSAHPYSAQDHEPAQGRQYTLGNYRLMQSGKDFEDAEGNRYKGFPRPVTEWNCRHFASYIILGISPRRYTDEQLKQFREANHKGCEIDGQHYTIYQASQLMRKLETKVRQQKDIANLAKMSGDDVLRRQAQANIRDLKAKYAEVAEKSGLRQRTDKMIVESYKSKSDLGVSGYTFSKTDMKQEKTGTKPYSIHDVTAEYENNATPGQGSVSYDHGYKESKHKDEVEVANWIYEKYGGDIKLLNESDVVGKKMPDYTWREKYWELKTTSTLNATDMQVRKALKQIADNPGGIILDYSDNEIDISAIKKVLLSRAKRAGCSDIDIIIKSLNDTKAIFRIKK